MNNRQRRAMAGPRPAQQARPAHTFDGLENLVLKIGAQNPITAAARYVPNGATGNYQQLEQLYRGSWLVGNAVDYVAEDMTRSGISLIGVDPDDAGKMQADMTTMGVWEGMTNTIKWGRLYGGAAALMMIDGQDTATPLDPDTVAKGQFTGLKVFDRYSLTPSPNYLIRDGQDMGLPEYYTVSRLGLTIHHSRLLRQVGIELPWNQAQIEQGWGASIVERILDRIVPFDTATAGAASLLTRASLRVVQVDRLREILAQGGVAEENLIKMFKLISLLQSSEGITLIDKEDTFNSYNYSFGGVNDIMVQFAQQISGATGIPLVRLFGQSPGGLGATGEGEMRQYHENIDQKRESQLRLPLMRLMQIIHRSCLGSEPAEDFDFEYDALATLNAKEKAETGERLTKTIVEAYGSDAIDRPTMMRELKAIAPLTGLFGHITDEMIDEAQKLVDEAKLAPPGEGALDPLTGLPLPPPPVIGDPNAGGGDETQGGAAQPTKSSEKGKPALKAVGG